MFQNIYEKGTLCFRGIWWYLMTCNSM